MKRSALRISVASATLNPIGRRRTARTQSQKREAVLDGQSGLLAGAVLNFHPMFDRAMPRPRAPDRAKGQPGFRVGKTERQLACGHAGLNLLQPPSERVNLFTNPDSFHKGEWRRNGE